MKQYRWLYYWINQQFVIESHIVEGKCVCPMHDF